MPKATEQTPGLLTVEEAAKYLRIDTETCLRLLRSGKIPGAKIGRQWRIRQAALDAWIDRSGAAE